MNVEIGAEAALFPEKEYINGIAVAVNSSWKFHKLADGIRKRQAVRGTSITYKIPPAGPLSSSQSGGPPCWASPLAFGLLGGS